MQKARVISCGFSHIPPESVGVAVESDGGYAVTFQNILNPTPGSTQRGETTVFLTAEEIELMPLNDRKSVLASIRSLSSRVGVWGNANFDMHAPYAGAAEESGELVHAKLKRAQGIRGTPEEHRANEVDAYADISIYLAHLLHKLSTKEKMDNIQHRIELGHLFMAMGRLMSDPTDERNLNQAIDTLVILANLDNVDLSAEMERVWANVSKRDWRKFPKNGLTE